MVSFADFVVGILRNSEIVFFMQLILLGVMVWVGYKVADAYTRLGRYVGKVEAIFNVIFTDDARRQIEQANVALKSFQATIEQLQQAQKAAQKMAPQLKPEAN